jgi:hypothetical protein
VLAKDFDFQCGPFIPYNMLKKPWQQVWQQVDLRLFDILTFLDYCDDEWGRVAQSV